MYILGAVILILVILVAATYNVLVKLRNQCRESWADVDAELKRRYDLIPNLVEVVKGYARYEHEVLERVVAARNQAVGSTGSPASQAKDEIALVGSLRSLFAVVENYPDLKASAQYLKLQEELANTEDRIQAARRFYNGNVRDYNTRCEVLPSNVIAGLFGFTREEFFEVETAVERAVPKV
jgi:LemA protein